MTTTLLLQASDIHDSAHWYWRLHDADHAFLADHTVALDPADWRYEALLDLYGYLERRVAPDKRQTEETRLLAELGAWLGEQVLGPIAPALMNHAPVTVRVQMLDDTPAAAGLCYLPLELAYAGGKPLAVQEVSLVGRFTFRPSNRKCRAPAGCWSTPGGRRRPICCGNGGGGRRLSY